MRFATVEGEDRGEVKLFTLSSCAWCGKVKDLLNRLGVQYQYVDTDLLGEDEQEEIVGFLDGITEKWGFPVLLIHDKYLVAGYREKVTRELLGIIEVEAPGEKAGAGEPPAAEEAVEQACERLRKFCDKKGTFLNPDPHFTRKLVKSLLANQARYGYWACPCRLASGNREEDRDIICPCDYMKPDVEEFGACYCALYVSQRVFRGEGAPETVPERRKKKRGRG